MDTKSCENIGHWPTQNKIGSAALVKPYTNNNPTFTMDCSTIFLMILIAFGAIPLIGLVIGLFYIAYINPQFALFFLPICDIFCLSLYCKGIYIVLHLFKNKLLL